jgi:predicted nucleotidyltransferase
MVRRIVAQFQPDKVILVGSYARGTAGPDSDIDLLVVMPVVGSKLEKQVELRLAIHDIRGPKDVLVATPDELERQRDLPGTIVSPALHEGRVLYEKV